MLAAFAIRAYRMSGRDDLDGKSPEELWISVLKHRVCKVRRQLRIVHIHLGDFVEPNGRIKGRVGKY